MSVRLRKNIIQSTARVRCQLAPRRVCALTLALLAGVSWSLAAGTCTAQTGTPVAGSASDPSAQASALDAAAEHYDAGVRAFDRANYDSAARAFLRADALAPSVDALSNALTSATRGSDHLLVAEVASRILERVNVGVELEQRARRALAFAATRLSVIDVQCRPLPCGIVIDGAKAAAGVHYLLPGNHELVATAGDGKHSERALELAAGTTYRVLIHADARQAGSEVELTSKPGPKTALKPEAGELQRRPGGADADIKPLPPWVFYTGAAITLVVAGVTTLSGMDALSARDDLPSAPRQSELDSVESKIARTDLLLGASVALAALTGYIGLFQVEWGGVQAQAGLGWVGVGSQF